jgi:hypothetical protein
MKFLNTFLTQLFFPLMILIAHSKEWLRLELFLTGTYVLSLLINLFIFLVMGETFWKFESTLAPEKKTNWNSVLVAGLVKMSILVYTEHFFPFVLCVVVYLIIFQNCNKFLPSIDSNET